MMALLVMVLFLVKEGGTIVQRQVPLRAWSQASSKEGQAENGQGEA